LKRVLRELGLTEYETDAYLSLIEWGVMNAIEISKRANVPYSKVYGVLNGLVSKGWVEVEQGRPSKYFPRAPLEAFNVAKMRFEDKLKSWERTVLGELQPLYERKEFHERPDIWILRGEQSVLARLEEIVSKAKNELMIAAPSFAKPLANAVFPSLSRLQNSETKVFLMITGDVKEWNLKFLAGLGEVRIREHMFGGGIIADAKEAMLMLGEDKLGLVIWSNHIGLVRFARDYFEYLWNSSKKV
jgi:sugar-specific transcriptional regulator TrmB